MFTPINFKNPNTRNLRSTSLIDSSNQNSKESILSGGSDQTSFTNILQEKISESNENPKTNTVNTRSNSQGIGTTKETELTEIASLVGELEQLGEGLSRLPSLDNFFLYRKALQKILKKAVPQALELQKDYSLSTVNLSQKEFHLIKQVNEEVNSLLKLIDSEHKNHFIIANKVVSIKGLIVDFYS